MPQHTTVNRLTMAEQMRVTDLILSWRERIEREKWTMTELLVELKAAAGFKVTEWNARGIIAEHGIRLRMRPRVYKKRAQRVVNSAPAQTLLDHVESMPRSEAEALAKTVAELGAEVARTQNHLQRLTLSVTQVYDSLHVFGQRLESLDFELGRTPIKTFVGPDPSAKAGG